MFSHGDLNKQFLNKLESLEADQKDILNKFIDVFLEFNSEKKNTRVNKILNLSNQINEYAYKNGMSKELADKLISEIS